jgi:hypothetical protein
MSILRWKQKVMFADGGVLRDSGGGGGSAPSGPTTSTVTNTNIPEYAQPYVMNMLQAAQSQIFNPEMTGINAYNPYSTNPQDYVAGFSPLQQQAQSSAANLRVPGQYGAASNLAGTSAMGALGTTGQAGMYGGMGARAGQMGAGLSNLYGGAGAQAGQQAAGLSNMYGGLGSLAGQQGANIGASLGQQSTSPSAVGAYMNPYIQNALAPAQQLLNQQYGMQGAAQQGAATQQGAFGGSRNALMQGLNQQNQMLAQNQLVGNAYQNAYTNAQQQMNAANQAALAGNQQALTGYGMGLQGAGQAGSQAMQGLGMGLQGAGQAANLGMQGAQAGLAGVGAQQAGYSQAANAANVLGGLGGAELAAQQGIIGTQTQQGAAQQAQQQQIINQAVQNYATAQQYPMMQLANMSGLLRGLPLQATSTQSYQAAPSTVSQLSGLGLTGAAAYGLMKKKGGKISEKEGSGLADIRLHKLLGDKS